MSLKRFFQEKAGLAPESLGSPNIIQSVDYQVFKKTEEQKGDAITAKIIHKKYMKKRGYDPNKTLNVPELSLETPIIINT